MVKKIFLTSITLFLIWYFINGVPLDFYAGHIAGVSYLGSGLITIVLGVTISRLVPKKIMDNDKESDGIGYIMLIVLIGVFFGGADFLMNNTDKRIAAEYRDHGITTTAVVDDGSSVGNGNIDFTSIRLRFFDENGKTRHGFIKTTPEGFEKHYLHEQLTIMYSRRYPTMVKIMRKI
jgi:hypothetical protein